jgi:D-lactate dehydrogenase (cytochrome)
MVLIDPEREQDLAEAKAFNERLVKRALDMEGTCTGEHGVGFGKREWLKEEHGEAVELMRMIKRAFDPENLLNPGKVLPPA